MMLTPALQGAARSHSSSPERKLFRTPRVFKYIFLDGCKNIPASYTLDSEGTRKVYKESVSCCPKVKHNTSTAADCCPPLPSYFCIFLSRLLHQVEVPDDGSKKRLPVFRQLCGEAVPDMALEDMNLQNSSEELKELTDAKARGTKGWKMKQAAQCSPCREA